MPEAFEGKSKRICDLCINAMEMAIRWQLNSSETEKNDVQGYFVFSHPKTEKNTLPKETETGFFF